MKLNISWFNFVETSIFKLLGNIPLWCQPPVWRNESVQNFRSYTYISLFSARKSQNAASRFFIERIGLKENYSTKLRNQRGYKRRPSVKTLKLHLKGRSQVQASSSHLGVKRHFAVHNFIPKPFDSSSVKGKILFYYRRMQGGTELKHWLFI